VKRRRLAGTQERNLTMSKVIAIMSMSLDGYVADRNGSVAEVMGWYMTSGDTEVQTAGAAVGARARAGDRGAAWGHAALHMLRSKGVIRAFLDQAEPVHPMGGSAAHTLHDRHQ
jgi:hypothetical protein